MIWATNRHNSLVDALQLSPHTCGSVLTDSSPFSAFLPNAALAWLNTGVAGVKVSPLPWPVSLLKQVQLLLLLFSWCAGRDALHVHILFARYRKQAGVGQACAIPASTLSWSSLPAAWKWEIACRSLSSKQHCCASSRRRRYFFLLLFLTHLLELFLFRV